MSRCACARSNSKFSRATASPVRIRFQRILLRAVERPHGMRLEFSGGGIPALVRVTVSRTEYQNQRDNREWVIQFPSDALRVL